MHRKYLAISAAVAVLALIFATTALSRGSSTPTLKGVVGPGYTITLKKAGKAVKRLKAGKYIVRLSTRQGRKTNTFSLPVTRTR